MLRDQIAEELKDAMKARDQVRVGTLRMLITAIKNTQVERMHELDDDEVIEVAGKEAKRRRESIEAFTSAGRQELADKEAAELRILEAYLPEALSEQDLARLVQEAVAETGATSARDMGNVMKALMPRIKGRADGGAVSAMVKAALSE